MDFLVTILILTISLHGIHSKKLDPGPQVFNDTTKLLPQTSHKRYATKEIILYLTPSQIRALQEEQRLITHQYVPHGGNEEKTHALANAQAAAQAHALELAQAHVLAKAQENAQAHAVANAQAKALADAQEHVLASTQAKVLENAQEHANEQAQALANAQAHALANSQAHAAVQHAHEEHFRHLPPPLPLRATPVEEPHSDHFVPIIPPPEYRHSDNYAYINFHPPNNPHIPRPVPFVPEPHEHASLNPHKELPLLIPNEPLPEKIHEISHGPGTRDHLKEQWYRLLDQNRAHLNALVSSSHYLEKLNEHKKDVLQYAPNFNDQKYAFGVEQLIRHNHQLQLEKQHALLQAAAIANSPPVVVHKEISIKHSPVHLIKQVKVPVPTPVLIPVPEPFEVRVPQPYPVPLEIIKPVPVPLANAHKIHFDKQIPRETERHFHFPITKPYFQERVIPLDGSEHKLGGLPVHSHPWKH